MTSVTFILPLDIFVSLEQRKTKCNSCNRLY